MKICPSCKEEFLDHVEICQECQQQLVHDFEQAQFSNDDFLSKEELFSEEMEAFVEGNLANCREIEGVLARNKISCAIYPVSLKSSDTSGQTLGTTGELRYLVLLRPKDVLRAKEALEGKFYNDVLREGRGELVTDVVDLSSDMITCPACAEQGALENGECKNCGLYLGEEGCLGEQKISSDDK